MALNRHRMILVAVSCVAFLARAASFAVSLVDRWLGYAIDAIADPGPALALVRERWAPLAPAGSPLDPALLNGIRHESRIARQGAHRNI